MRIGYGVRLLPKPYNHPIRTAESVAVLDLVSDGRVEFGTGRSSTRAEIEGFGIDPHETREMWDEALRPHRRHAGPTTSTRSTGKHWSMPPPARAPEAVAEAAPADLGRDVERRGPLRDRQAAASACCRSPSATRPRSSRSASQNYRRGQADCTEPVGKFVQRDRGDVHDGALQRHQREGTGRRRGVVRLVPEDRGAQHRVARRVHGRSEARISATTATRARR